MSLLNSLQNVLGGAEHGIGNAIGTFTHPVLTKLDSIFNDFTNSRPGIAPYPGNYSETPDGAPNLNNLKANPTSVGRVWGTAVAANTADQQGYTPSFRSTVMGAHPYVGQGTAGLTNQAAGGDYVPTTNQIELRSDHLDPVTVTHEGLHADWQHETPDQRLAFYKLLPQFNSDIQKGIHSNFGIGNVLYKNNNLGQNINEEHSFVPYYNQSMDTKGQDPQATKYYQQYFNDPLFDRQKKTSYQVANKTGLAQALYYALHPNAPHYQPQFSDYKNE